MLPIDDITLVIPLKQWNRHKKIALVFGSYNFASFTQPIKVFVIAFILLLKHNFETL